MARPKVKNLRKVKSVRVPVVLQGIDLTWIINEMEIAYSKVEKGNADTDKIINRLGFVLISQINSCVATNELGRNNFPK